MTECAVRTCQTNGRSGHHREGRQWDVRPPALTNAGVYRAAMTFTDLINEAFDHYALLPVGKDSKACLIRHWNRAEFAKEDLLSHARRGGNIGARVGQTRQGIRVLVVDRDARDLRSWRFLQEHRLQRSNMQVETASGNWHLWFRVPQEIEDLSTRIKLLVEGERLPIDAKATGYVLVPGSQIGGKEYRFRDGKGFKKPEDLEPVSDSFLELLRRETPAPVVTAGIAAVRERATRIVCPEKYVLRIPSVMGQNGSAGLVRAIHVLKSCGWDGPRIVEFLCNVWNPACAIPEWSRDEIVRAVHRHCGES